LYSRTNDEVGVEHEREAHERGAEQAPSCRPREQALQHDGGADRKGGLQCDQGVDQRVRPGHRLGDEAEEEVRERRRLLEEDKRGH